MINSDILIIPKMLRSQSQSTKNGKYYSSTIFSKCNPIELQSMASNSTSSNHNKHLSSVGSQNGTHISYCSIVNKPSNQISMFYRDCEEDVENSSQQLEVNDANRITFNQAFPIRQKNCQQINKNSVIDIPRCSFSREKTSLYKEKMVGKKCDKNENKWNINWKKYDKNESKVWQLEQVIERMQEQNKSLMKDAQNMIWNFQKSINQLLAENQQLQKQIDKVQKQRDLHLATYRKSYLEIQNMMEQKKLLQREVDKWKEKYNQLQLQVTLTGVEQMSAHKNQAVVIERLKEQIGSQKELITLMENSVYEKEVIIKKLAKFNNELCLEILDLKAFKIQIQVQEKCEKQTELIAQNKRLKQFITQLQTKISQIQHQYDKVLTIQLTNRSSSSTPNKSSHQKSISTLHLTPNEQLGHIISRQSLEQENELEQIKIMRSTNDSVKSRLPEQCRTGLQKRSYQFGDCAFGVSL